MHLLYIGDDLKLSESLLRQEAGLEIHKEPNPLRASAWLQSRPPLDGIIAEYQLPGVPGRGITNTSSKTSTRNAKPLTSWLPQSGPGT